MLNVPRSGIFAEMGLGKTTASMNAIEMEFLSGLETRPALVLAPKLVAQSTWPDESKEWEHLRNIEVRPILGTPDQRRAALKDKNASIFTINYENIPWLMEELNGRWPFGRIVADESTRLKNYRIKQGGKRAHALGEVAHTKVKRFTNLTGSPSPNGLQDLWGQTWFLDEGLRLGRSFAGFEQRWFGKSRDGYGLKAFPHAQKEIQHKLKDICLSLSAKDYFDLQEPIITNKYFDLPPKVRVKYDEMEKKMYTEVAAVLKGVARDKLGIEAVNAASRTNKCLQIANGAMYLDWDVWDDDHPKAKEWVEMHDMKLQVLESIINEAAGMPVLVAYFFKSDLVRLKKTFPKGRVMDDNPQTIRDWNAGKIPVLFGHPASMGHGLNLQHGGNIGVVFGFTWNLEHYEQFIARNGPVRQMQSGYNRPYFLYHIIARNTQDERVLRRLTTKKSVQEILMEDLKAKGYL